MKTRPFGQFLKFMPSTLVAMALLLIAISFCHATENIAPVRDSVVRIRAVSSQPNYRLPWNRGFSGTSWGTGFYIGEGKLLTNAHVASDAEFISIGREGDSRRYEARVKYIAHDCDLALLEVVDPRLFRDMRPLKLGDIPALDSQVTVVGYPIGGSRISITRGIVSRIDYQRYAHSGIDSHLSIQIDAAINPGNSGGPVFQEGRVVGVAFQAFASFQAQNIGYMIPTPVIKRFLADIADGHYDHYVDLGLRYWALINPGQRRALNLPAGDFGVLVSEVLAAGSAHGQIEAGDILLDIDNHPISSDGHVLLDGNRVLLDEVVERKFKGDTVTITLLRGKQKKQVRLSLVRPWPYLMMAKPHDVRPRYTIFGGLVFQPLSAGYLGANQTTDTDILYYYKNFMQNETYRERPEPVLLTKVLPAAVNTGIDTHVPAIIDRINGVTIRSLENVAQAFQKKETFHVIQLMGKNQPVVLDAAAAAAAHPEILSAYGIPADAYFGDSIIPADFFQSEIYKAPQNQR